MYGVVVDCKFELAKRCAAQKKQKDHSIHFQEMNFGKIILLLYFAALPQLKRSIIIYFSVRGNLHNNR